MFLKNGGLIGLAKLAVVITDKFEDSEYTSPKEALEVAGHSLVTIEREVGKVVTGDLPPFNREVVNILK